MDLSRPWQVAIVQRKASGKKQAEAYITVNERYFLGQTQQNSA